MLGDDVFLMDELVPIQRQYNLMVTMLAGILDTPNPGLLLATTDSMIIAAMSIGLENCDEN
jgi:hypothetical protein